MIRKLITWDNNNNRQKVNIYDQYKTIDLVVKDDHIPVSWYKYDNYNNSIPPFVTFVNNKLAIFCNDLSQANYESLSLVGKNLLYFYHSILNKNLYTDNFQCYKIKNKNYLITWKISKDFSMKFNNETKDEVIINYNPATTTQFEAMTKLLANSYHGKIMNMIKDYSFQMGLADKISYSMITDPDSNSRYNGVNPFTTPVAEVGVLGTSFKTKEDGRRNTYSQDSNKRCIIHFSPIIYFMSPEQQKILIYHELAHIKVGVNHGHDSFFWATFEKYSGISREKDWSYNESIEKKDTEYYDKYWTRETGNNAYLIEKYINNKIH